MQYRLKAPARDSLVMPVSQSEAVIDRAPAQELDFAAGVSELFVLAERPDSKLVNPFGGYDWISPTREQHAMDHFEGAVLAHANRLPNQVHTHLTELLETYHEDLVQGHVLPVLRYELKPFEAKILTSDFLPDRGPSTWRADGLDWRAVPVDDFKQMIPVQALRALTLVRKAGIPFQDWWVVHDTPVPTPQALGPRLDPYLAGRMWRYLISVAWWL